MGANTSTLRAEEVSEMQSVSHFTPKEIKRLYKRFKRLDKDEKGSISTEEFLTIPELSMNPLNRRIIAIFDSNKDGQVNFKEFVRSLSAFHPRGDREEKVKFAFQVYDIDGDGFIRPDELFQILKMMVGNNLTDEQIRKAAQETFSEADRSKKGKLDYDDFSEALANTDIAAKMTVRF